jgi:hypothetical protein
MAKYLLTARVVVETSERVDLHELETAFKEAVESSSETFYEEFSEPNLITGYEVNHVRAVTN